MIALFQRRHAGAGIDHHTGALMPEDGREDAFRVGARQRELIGMAHTRGLDLDQHFAGARTVEVNLHDLKWLACFQCYRCSCTHPVSPAANFACFTMIMLS